MKNNVMLAFAFTIGVLFSACVNKAEADFSILPVMGSNGEYQYIDVSQKGKIVINPQFSEACIFRDGLAKVKTSGIDGKWGYIDKKGKFAITPVYSVAQDFSDGVAWVQLEDQPPMLIDKNGKMLLQIDSLVTANPFSNGVAGISLYTKGNVFGIFINKKGEPAATTTEGQVLRLFINEDYYAVQNKETSKWGYKNKKGEMAIKEQFDIAGAFIDGMAIVVNGNKWGAINKKGDFIIKPQFDELSYNSDGLFSVQVGKKYGWVNKKGEIIINPQFDAIYGFYGDKLAPVLIGSKWGYIDRKGQIAINPQFDAALPFYGDYAMITDNYDRIGFIDKKGNVVVSPLYPGNLDDFYEYLFAIMQNALNYPAQYMNDDIYQNGNFLSYQKLREKQVSTRIRNAENLSPKYVKARVD